MAKHKQVVYSEGGAIMSAATYESYDNSSGAARAARSLLRRRLAGAKRIEVVLKPEAARALAVLRQRGGRTISTIIEGLLERAGGLRRAG